MLRYRNERYRTLPDEKIINIWWGLWKRFYAKKYMLSREKTRDKWLFPNYTNNRHIEIKRWTSNDSYSCFAINLFFISNLFFNATKFISDNITFLYTIYE